MDLNGPFVGSNLLGDLIAKAGSLIIACIEGIDSYGYDHGSGLFVDSGLDPSGEIIQFIDGDGIRYFYMKRDHIPVRSVIIHDQVVDSPYHLLFLDDGFDLLNFLGIGSDTDDLI